MPTAGGLDTSFGAGGIVTTSYNGPFPGDAALQPDGKIVVAGEAESAGGTVSEFAIARFNANGTPDAGFGSGGKVTTNIVGAMPGGVSNPAQAVLIQADGKIPRHRAGLYRLYRGRGSHPHPRRYLGQ